MKRFSNQVTRLLQGGMTGLYILLTACSAPQDHAADARETAPLILDVSDTFGPDDQSEQIHVRFEDAGIIALLEAAREADLDAMEALVNQGVDINHSGAADGIHPLTAYVGYVRPVRTDVVTKFLTLGADPALPAKNNMTLLNALAKSADPAIADTLLEAGVSPDVHWMPADMSFISAAMTARNHNLVARLLDAGADPNQPKKRQDLRPFEQAVTVNDWVSAKMLLDHGADPRLGDPDLEQTVHYWRSFDTRDNSDEAAISAHKAIGDWLRGESVI